ncbi:hypothetical protein K501DRAFT_195102 [Backusella circina FSU 941]|nr:hypothetical protein K501DRAFT_195102 [Backusella circina FSU 941]
MSQLVFNPSNKLHTFLLLSRSVKGKANSQLISDALSAPGVYVFTELFQAPNLVEASTLPEVIPYYQLLQVFLYGSYADYKAKSNELPALTASQVKKLKQLSIITLSEKSQVISYQTLQQSLEIDSIRELEDLIMDAFYQGILSGKLDQHKQQLHIMSSIGRDVRSSQLDETIDILATWSGHTQGLVDALNAKITLVQEQVAAQQQARDEYASQIEQVRQQVRTEGPTKKLPTMEIFEQGRGSRRQGGGSDDRKR